MQVASIFVPVVVSLALVTWLCWYSVTFCFLDKTNQLLLYNENMILFIYLLCLLQVFSWNMWFIFGIMASNGHQSFCVFTYVLYFGLSHCLPMCIGASDTYSSHGCNGSWGAKRCSNQRGGCIGTCKKG